MTLHRRRFQFSLRTFLVAIVLASAAFGWWIHRTRDWIRQRNDFVASGNVTISLSKTTQAPGGLSLFGEEGVAQVWCDITATPEEIKRAKALFPEADKVWVWAGSMHMDVSKVSH